MGLSELISKKETKWSAKWASQNIVLPSHESAVCSRYDTARHPALVSLTEAFYSAKNARELHVQKSSQCGLTLTALTMLIHQRLYLGGNAIIVADSLTQSKALGKRFEDIIEASFAKEFAYRTKYQRAKMEKNFNDGTVWLLGAGSAGQLASKNATFAVADEVNKHREISGETNTVALLRQRLKTHNNSKLIACSTPTTADGQITRLIERAEFCAAYKAPCPHCKERIEINNLFDAPSSAIRCPRCAHEIDTNARKKMIAQGKWDKIPTGAKSIGAHLSDLLIPSLSNEDILAEWANAKDTQQKQEFFLNRLGKCWDWETEEEIRVHEMLRNATDAPDVAGGDFKILAIDVQERSYKWMLVSFPQSSYALKVEDFGEYEGALPDLCRSKSYDFCVVDDGGHRTWQNRAEATTYRKELRIQLLKGTATRMGANWAWKTYRRQKHDKDPSVPVLVFIDEVYKDKLIDMLDVTRLVKLPNNPPIDLIQELSCERAEMIRDRNGRTRKVYKYRYRANDWQDALKMALVAADMLHQSQKLPKCFLFQ